MPNDTSTDKLDRLITEKEAATLLGLSPSWMQRKRWEGGGPPFVKFDHAVRYRLRDLEAWIEIHAGHRSTSGYVNRPKNIGCSNE